VGRDHPGFVGIVLTSVIRLLIEAHNEKMQFPKQEHGEEKDKEETGMGSVLLQV
jgi:hypothetical protein